MEIVFSYHSYQNLINSLRDKSINYNDLLTKLADVGYSISDNNIYDKKFRYQIAENRIYYVSDEFPRIIDSSFEGDHLPNRIIDINYLIDLITEPPFPISQKELSLLFEEFCK